VSRRDVHGVDAETCRAETFTARGDVPEKVWIVGAGAVGLYLAAKLATCAEVTVVARSSRTEALASEGFSLSGLETSVVRPNVVAFESLEEIPRDALLLLAVKATQLEAALAPLAPRLAAGQVVGLCQNGLGIAALASRIAPSAELVRVACWFGASLVGPREVKVAGVYQLELGADGPLANLARERLEVLLNAAGLPVSRAASVASCEWRKSLWNLAVSATCALLDEPNGVVLDDIGLHSLASDVLVEALEIASLEGVSLSAQDVAQVFASTERTRENLNAMLLDVRRGAPTEMPFLNAEVARLARRHGRSAPVNETLARLVNASRSVARRSS